MNLTEKALTENLTAKNKEIKMLRDKLCEIYKQIDKNYEDYQLNEMLRIIKNIAGI